MLRKIIALLLVLSIILALTACSPASENAVANQPEATQPTGGEQPANAEKPVNTDQTETSVATVTENEWGIANKMNDGSETTDELYALAQKEGAVVMYSISSRCTKVAESFNAQYPGVVMEAYDLNTAEIVEKVTREYDSGIQNCDVVHAKDMDGAKYNELVLTNILHNYYPDDISAHIDEGARKYAMPLYIELISLFYNYELCNNTPPITSWWDLTKEEWAGKYYLPSMSSTGDYVAIMTAFTMYSDDFAADYKKVFGEDITYTCGIENAGYELLYRLVKNNPLVIGSVDEGLETLSLSNEVLIGWGPSSKIRNNESKGWKLAPINVTPYTGIPAQNNLYIVDNCAHPNAAKLLVRWMLGESDGNGEGRAPWATLGGWSVRDDVTDAEGQIPLDEILLCESDPVYIYENIADVVDFFIAANS